MLPLVAGLLTHLDQPCFLSLSGSASFSTTPPLSLAPIASHAAPTKQDHAMGWSEGGMINPSSHVFTSSSVCFAPFSIDLHCLPFPHTASAYSLLHTVYFPSLYLLSLGHPFPPNIQWFSYSVVICQMSTLFVQPGLPERHTCESGAPKPICSNQGSPSAMWPPCTELALHKLLSVPHTGPGPPKPPCSAMAESGPSELPHSAACQIRPTPLP